MAEKLNPNFQALSTWFNTAGIGSRVLHSHGMMTTSLQDIFRVTVILRILYAAPSWSVMCSAVLIRCYVAENGWATAEATCRSSQNCSILLTMIFFQRVKTNSSHVLKPYLPQHTVTPYQLCTHPHNITLTNKTKFLNDTDFIIRMLCKSHTNSLYLSQKCRVRKFQEWAPHQATLSQMCHEHEHEFNQPQQQQCKWLCAAQQLWLLNS